MCSGKSEHFLSHMWHPSRLTKITRKSYIAEIGSPPVSDAIRSHYTIYTTGLEWLDLHSVTCPHMWILDSYTLHSIPLLYHF